MVDEDISNYGDWSIYTLCRKNNPANWQAGQPARFAVRGTATFAGNSKGAWASTEPILWNDGLETHAPSDRVGHDEIQAFLKAEIDRRKVAPA